MFGVKKIVNALILVTFTFSGVYANTTTSSSDNGYKTPIIDNNLDFSANRDGNKIKMNWTTYENSNFSYYKIIRSETLSNPVYPDNGYIKAISNKKESEAIIEDNNSNFAIYRVCVITSEKDRYCSNTVKLEGYKKINNPTSNIKTEKVIVNEKNETKISSTLEKKANQIVESFAKKIEEKISGDSDKIKAYETVIIKLDELAKKQNKYRNLVDYITIQLKRKMEKYNGDFTEIEKIFNEVQ